MTKREIKNMIKVREDTLTLINDYEQDYLDILGKQGLRDLVNKILDEIIYLRKQLKKFNNNE